jgi:hypothetical protein
MNSSRHWAVLAAALGSFPILGCHTAANGPKYEARSWDTAAEEDTISLNAATGPGEAEAITVLQADQPLWPAGTVLVIRTARIQPYVRLAVPRSMVTTAQATPFPNRSAQGDRNESPSLPAVWVRALADGSNDGRDILKVRIENLIVTDLRVRAVRSSLARGGAWTTQLGPNVPPQTLYLVRGYVSGKLAADTSRTLTPKLFTAITTAPGLKVAPNNEGGFSMADPRPRPLFQIVSTIVRRPATASYALAQPTPLELWNLLNTFNVSATGRAGASATPAK